MDVEKIPSQEFVGHLNATPDGYWFVPCNAAQDTRWWVTFVGETVDAVTRARQSGELVDGRPAFVRWQAGLTDERAVGPGGPALLVRRITELRPAQSGDCPQ